MKTNKLLIVSVLAVAFLGCGKREPRHIVILPDVSGSIKRESLEQAFNAIDELAGHLQRGDRLTIIPILGDAEAEASGRILRFEVPANRQAYDTDLRDFRSRLSSSLKEMENRTIAHPGKKTDILGSFALAQQEFGDGVSPSKRIIIILSDFIQETDDLEFSKDRHLANSVLARKFATELLRDRSVNFQQAHIYLGLLRSTEYATLSRKRRDAIQEFWLRYCSLAHGQAQGITDGVGLMRIF